LSKGLVENDRRTICRELVVEIYGVHPSESEVDLLVEARFEAFIQLVEIQGGVQSLLNELRQHYRLGFLSNYSCSRSILAGLKKTGLSEMFKSRTISGDVGYVKPHRKPFEVMLRELALAPEKCVYVGDNWLADVQGSKRIGMYSILTTQFAPYEKIDPAEGDFSPDARISHIRELGGLFL
jgi:HAD superfamily hydrolase (TIGR01549 family)